jgi:chorismate mutase/prephenate dehydratase
VNIPGHRKAIDSLDARIVRLLNERTRHVLEIGRIKHEAGEEIYSPHREIAVLDRVSRMNEGPIPDESIRAIYREVMSSALSVEKSMTIAYLGPEATFTHQAAVSKFGSSLRYSPQKTIADVFSEVSRGRAEYGIVPVENSTEGIVTHTLDIFAESDLKIVAQVVLPIQQCLLSRVPRRSIKKLYVHPQSWAQCRTWIAKKLPRAEIVLASSNARSAQLAARDRKSGAIAGSLTAKHYGLTVLETDIQDNAANATRFLVLGRACPPPTKRDRTSLMLCLGDTVGSLHRALATFRRNRINLTRIESRPSKRKAWEYLFFVDFDGHQVEPRTARTIEQLRHHCSLVKVLGSYPNVD